MALLPTPLRQSLRKAAPWAALVFLVLLGAIQLIPYGMDHRRAPEPNPFKWRAPEAEALAKAACYDCHSNETVWWWAVKIAPFSWLAQSDIDEAKGKVNFSDWNGRLTGPRLRRALDHGMPPWYYSIAHPHTRLTEAQKQTLVDGFQASLPKP